jgi:hypothetical protein
MSNFSNYVILCGMPRCGTRQFADLLDRDDRVCLQGEIKQSMILPIYELVKAADAAYVDGTQLKYYQKKRALAVAEMFSFFSKANRNVKLEPSIHGFKTPNIEFLHEMLSAIFLPSTDRLNYLYCIRNIKDCYLSLTSMVWFNKTQEQFIARYIRSLKTAVELSNISKMDGSKVAVGILNLNSYIEAQDKADWLISRIYRPLGIDIAKEQAIKIVSTTENRNATERATGKSRPKNVTDEVHAVFLKNKNAINSAVVEFNDAFGESLQLYE